MRVLKHSTLVSYWLIYPITKPALVDWYDKTTSATWANPADIRATFPQVDRVKVESGNTVYIFNIGRAHRLIAAVHFDFPRVFVLRLMDHKEYDLDQWKTDL
ncbi:MAG TPA: type II toxin-antitoxin system HigB family toxin [Tepidisphaeraceae bacterium]|jgi:mRNA interferase HigB|nr:type II toxin-antitoxin system HigB family toxin [Tepidisphaeraceae bacterium]